MLLDWHNVTYNTLATRAASVTVVPPERHHGAGNDSAAWAVAIHVSAVGLWDSFQVGNGGLSHADRAPFVESVRVDGASTTTLSILGLRFVRRGTGVVVADSAINATALRAVRCDSGTHVHFVNNTVGSTSQQSKLELGGTFNATTVAVTRNSIICPLTLRAAVAFYAGTQVHGLTNVCVAHNRFSNDDAGHLAITVDTKFFNSSADVQGHLPTLNVSDNVMRGISSFGVSAVGERSTRQQRFSQFDRVVVRDNVIDSISRSSGIAMLPPARRAMLVACNAYNTTQNPNNEVVKVERSSPVGWPLADSAAATSFATRCRIRAPRPAPSPVIVSRRQ